MAIFTQGGTWIENLAFDTQRAQAGPICLGHRLGFKESDWIEQSRISGP